uniref:Gsp_54 putative toxin n=1 Tax=Gemmula speciosa TaxID=439592 RepID=A0A098LXS0_GEMSP
MRFYVFLIAALFLTSFMDAAPVDQAETKRMKLHDDCVDCFVCGWNYDDPDCAKVCEECKDSR